MEADASDTGVGAVLSQRSASDHKLHPCAFFSRRLSPAERNYDDGNHERTSVSMVAHHGHGRSFIYSGVRNLHPE